MPLEDYYAGDNAFANLASTPDQKLDEQFAAWPEHEELRKLCANDRSLARVIFYHNLTHALEYMHTAIPALKGLTPIECLKSETGTKRLKESLLRHY